MRALTPRQQRFAELRLLGHRPTDAARRAGYRNTGALRITAHRLARHPAILAAIAAMEEGIREEAWRRFRRRRPVSPQALRLLLGAAWLTPRQRERVSAAVAAAGPPAPPVRPQGAMARVREAARQIAAALDR